jgi:transcription termination factor Rho
MTPPKKPRSGPKSEAAARGAEVAPQKPGSIGGVDMPKEEVVSAFLGPITEEEAADLDARYEALKRDPPRIADVETDDDEALRRAVASLGPKAADDLSRDELKTEYLRRAARRDGLCYAEGVVEILPDGYAFLRDVSRSFAPGPDDVYVAPSQVRRFGLRNGAKVQGQIRPPKRNEKFFALLRVEAVDGESPERVAARPRFEDLPPSHPSARFTLETGPEPFSTRVLDLVAPIGKGQRALIAAPPRSGKTTLLSEIADALARNHKDVALFVLLVDERPEEAAEFARRSKADVVRSTFDDATKNHLRVAELTLERAKRLVEGGRDVVVLLDSLTRLARASNADAPSGGRVLSGGVDATALARPKKFFGAARAIDGGGSLTVIATALVETGSRMDDVIYEEFRGTGNAEIALDRKTADARVFPAIDVTTSGTRRHELLVAPEVARRVGTLRALLSSMPQKEAAPFLIENLRRFPSNAALLEKLRG